MDNLVKQIANYVRSVEIPQGDQYGTWLAPSPDAQEIARKIEETFYERSPDSSKQGTTYGILKPE